MEPEIVLAADPAADVDDVEVFVFERSGPGDPWRQVSPAREPFDVAAAVAEAFPDRRPTPVKWEEKILTWDDRVKQWTETFAAGEFTLTPEQEDMLRKVYAKAIATGKLTVWSSADLMAPRRWRS
jgi:cation diffusion facilitator CzcD-associated flavoprotein CzcO